MEQKRITIGGRNYGILPMAPDPGIEFSAKVAALVSSCVDDDLSNLFAGDKTEEELSSIGLKLVQAISKLDPEKFTELAKEALAYEVWAENKKLSDSTAFNAWFSEHPSDYYPIAFWAIWEHSKGFFLGSAEGFQAVFGGSLFQSQKSGK